MPKSRLSERAAVVPSAGIVLSITSLTLSVDAMRTDSACARSIRVRPMTEVGS